MKKPRQQIPSPPQLQIAVRHHQAGRLQQAEAIYKKMPGNSDALHLSGVVAYQMGNYDLAIERISKALRSNPLDATYHCHLGLAYGALNQLDLAIAACQKAIMLMPDYVEAHNNLGNVLTSQGKRDEAVACYQRALTLKPDYVEAINNLAAVLRDSGKLDEALAYYQSALALRPDLFELHYNLGNTLKQQRKLDEAAACYRKALALKPDMAQAHNNLGAVYKDQGKLDEAVVCCQEALTLAPEMVEAHTCLGDIYRAQGKLDQALACFERAIALKPDYSDAYNCLGIVLLHSQGKLDQALACFERAIALKPDYTDAYNSLGMTLQSQGKLDQAIASYRHAIEIDPDYALPHDNLLFCHNYHPTLSATEIFAAYQRWNEQCARRFSVDLPPFANSRDPQRRLKIGYVSPDFRNHSVIHFAAPLIDQHDKSRFEVYCYYSHFQHDACTDRIIEASNHWIPCLEMSDDQLAQRIRDDGIDILIDLAGHTGGNRLLVFARKPAPVQASWLGFGYTTGLTAMDYFIGDPVFTPPEADTLFSETPYRLPHCFAVYNPPQAAPATGDLPAQRRGYVTFACLSRSERINARIIDVWAAILRRLPETRLRLDSKNFSDANLCRAIEAQFAAHGVPAAQLDMRWTTPAWAVYQDVDIVLDCFPHNSGTTTYEALWMGVPVITLADRPSVGCLGASILACIGKPEWIAADNTDYVNRTVALAQNLSLLTRERATLRQAMRDSPLLDQAGFVRDMEAAYRDMWRRWCGIESATEAIPAADAVSEIPDIAVAFEHHRVGRLAQAENMYREILRAQPNNVDALHSLGLLFQQHGDNAAAVSLIKLAIGLLPTFAAAHSNLGLVFEAGGKPDEAIAAYQRAIQVGPDFIDAYLNLANVLYNQGRLTEAIDWYRRTIARRPDYIGAYNNLALALHSQGRMDEAIACCKDALQITHDFAQAQSNLFFCHNYHPTLSATEIFSVYQQWNEQYAAQFSKNLPKFANDRNPQRRLRIGYVSPDFRDHSVSHFAAPLIEQHDKARFELFCYYSKSIHDAYTDRFKQASDHWVNCQGMSDDQLAQCIRDDGIDILIDLAGHTAGNRLLVFARKPAPVQASWLGFGYTTGLTAIDYFIGDAIFTPQGCEPLFSETLYRLPHAAWTYQPPQAAPEPGASPAARNGYVTFSCLSRTERINARMIGAWADILRRLPSARLRLDSHNFRDAGMRRDIEEQFIVLGVPAAQLEIGFTSPVWNVYQEVDIVLDCFPHNSGTTTYEALWMGVPVITLADRPSVGRLGASILSCIGKPQWIAADSDDYINRAVALAQDLKLLVEERTTLRQTMLDSPLLDQAGFVRDMEAAYRDMWDRWCENLQEQKESV